MRKLIFWLMLLGALGALGGCGGPGEPSVTPERLERGLVLVLTGIEGRSPNNTAIRDGLIEGGVPYAVEVVDWTVGVPLSYLVNQRYEQRNRDKAAEIAERIVDYRQDCPGRPVVLVGHSGGTAMAAWIAEALPDDQPVDGIIALASSLSPRYPLAEALASSRRGMVSFYSRLDWLFLGGGTTVFGTMDGQHTASAGRVGFEVPPDAPASYEKLYQVAWTGEMLAEGHYGGHLTLGARSFVAHFVAPLVLADQWSAERLDTLTAPTGQARRSEAKRLRFSPQRRR